MGEDRGRAHPHPSEDPRPADVLWFVECQNSYHPRGQDVSRATARLFHALGIDFAILGNEEKCAGECARLLGERGLFDTLDGLQHGGVRRVSSFNRLVTSGVHAYDAFIYRVPGAAASVIRSSRPRPSWRATSIELRPMLIQEVAPVRR